jgi:hypothetical protein
MGKRDGWITAVMMCAKRSGSPIEFLNGTIADIPQIVLSDKKVNRAVVRMGKSILVRSTRTGPEVVLDSRMLRAALKAYGRASDADDLATRAEKVSKRMQRARARSVRLRTPTSTSADPEPEGAGGAMDAKAEKARKRARSSRASDERLEQFRAGLKDESPSRDEAAEQAELIGQLQALEEEMPRALADALFAQLPRWAAGQSQPPEGAPTRKKRPVKKSEDQEKADHAKRAKQSKTRKKAMEWLVEHGLNLG